MSIYARRSFRGPLGTRITLSWSKRRIWWLSLLPRISVSWGPR